MSISTVYFLTINLTGSTRLLASTNQGFIDGHYIHIAWLLVCRYIPGTKGIHNTAYFAYLFYVKLPSNIGIQ